MTTTDIARPDALNLDRDRLAAYAYLARYGQPTRAGYEIALRQWFDWCAVHGFRPLDAQRHHIEVWRRELEEISGLKVSTVAGKLNVVCGFYKLAKLDRHIVDNPGEHIRRPSVPNDSTRHGLTELELFRCLDAAAQMGDQEHALICVLGLLGPRIGEVCALNVEDVGWQGPYRMIRVRREKGNDQGEVPIVPRTSLAIDHHLGTRTAGPLFLKRNGERLDRKAAARIVDRVVKAAGITGKRITPHSFRHGFITIALDKGASMRDVQNSMGYRDPRQVTRYDRNKHSAANHCTWRVAAAVDCS